jgi:mono/diheme cytochrome c family protein
MQKMFRTILTVCTGSVVAILLLTFGRAFAQDGNAENGKKAYYDHGCYGCHGYNGETGWRDLVGTNSPLVTNEEIFLVYLRARTDYTPLVPSTRMPAYPESALSDTDARDIYAYIRTFELDAPDVEDIPALQVILESAGKPLE